MLIPTSNVTRSFIAAAVMAIASLGISASDAQAGKYERNGVYAVGGNHFIIRVQRRADHLYLRAYRLAGDQWERWGRTTIPIRDLKRREAEALAGRSSGSVDGIYFTGRIVGYSDVDLDNPLNTELNRGSRRVRGH